MTQTLIELQNHLKDFDEFFINQCKKHGFTQEHTRRELLENPYRQALLKAYSDQFALEQKRVFLFEIKS